MKDVEGEPVGDGRTVPTDSAVRSPAPAGLQSDNLQAYIPGDRRRALAEGRPLSERATGAALFADISGFTPLTEALASELGPQRGAEELTAALDAVFSPLLEELERHGGDTIYFSGDAVTAWLDGDDGRVAVACALAMQELMARVGERTTPGGRRLRLGLKVAVAAGSARRFVVGDPDIQLIDVLAGALMDRLAEAEHAARTGEVVVESATAAALADVIVVSERRGNAGVSVVDALAVQVPLPAARSPLPSLPDEVVRQWLLPQVYERMSTGHGEFLAELRPGIPLFVHFTGIDFDDDPAAVAKLDEFVVAAQRVVDANGGNVLQLTIGDKGAYLYAVFGAPVAHGNDAARACSSALELLHVGRWAPVEGVRVGVGSGRLRSGTYGHPERRTYSCLGDPVNLAARLMMATEPRTALVSADVRSAAGLEFDWGAPRQLRLAGKSGQIEAWPLIGRRRRSVVPTPTDRPGSSFVGRAAESEALHADASEAKAGRGRVVVVTGPPGVGKSRLLAELERWLAEQGHRVRAGAAASYGPPTSYGVWQDLCRDAWGIDADATVAEVVARLDQVLAGVDEQLLPRLPLLGPLLGVLIPDTPLTASFDAKLRKTSVESLLIRLLEANAARGPIAFLIDAAEHLDELSWGLVEALSRRAPRMAVLIVIARRPSETEPDDLPLLGLDHVEEIRLAALDPQTSRRLVEDRLRARGADLLSDAALDRLTSMANGNPFHLEELVDHVVDRGLDPAAEDISLPTSVHSLELARIDHLAESPRRTLKVASVIGERFEVPVVAGTYPELGAEPDVAGYTHALAMASLVVPEAESVLAFAFRNATTRQVAYETITYGSRQSLHDRVVTWLETHAQGGVESNLDLLAHHAGHGSDDTRKRRYLLDAGMAAQSRYANEAAVGYFSQVLPLVEGDERAELHRRLGKVLELAGHWPEAQRNFEQASEIYEQRADESGRAHARTELAEIARKQGRFDDARRLLLLADEAFAATGDRVGRGTVLHLRGTLAAQQSHYADARAAYEESLAIRRSLGDDAKIGAILSNLAVVAEQLGDYDEARELNEQALAVRQTVGDPWAIAISQNNLGMIALLQEDYARATTHIAESMRLADQVGDHWVLAVGQHNYGNARRGVGDRPASGQAYAAALRAYVDHDDRWSLALLVEDVLLLAVDIGQDAAAIRLLGAADALRDELDAPRSPAPAAAMEAALQAVRERLGAAAEVEYAIGRGLALADVIAFVQATCG